MRGGEARRWCRIQRGTALTAELLLCRILVLAILALHAPASLEASSRRVKQADGAAYSHPEILAEMTFCA
jgi:hypothetical protein